MGAKPVGVGDNFQTRMTPTLLRKLFPRSCKRIENEGFEAAVIALGQIEQKQKQQFNQKHPRESGGRFKKNEDY